LGEVLTAGEGLFVVVVYLSFALMILAATMAAPVYLACGAVRMLRDLRRRLSPLDGVAASLRTTDRARGRAAAVLGDRFAEGRLDLEELDRRTTAAYQARTAADLAVLFADLPPPRRAARSSRLQAGEALTGAGLLLFAAGPARIAGAALVLASIVPHTLTRT
jgi:hypothetical protein